jgi:hypothetical protein
MTFFKNCILNLTIAILYNICIGGEKVGDVGVEVMCRFREKLCWKKFFTLI